jgi:HEAT repeat protein
MLMNCLKDALQEQETNPDFNGNNILVVQEALSAIGKSAVPPVVAMLEDEKRPTTHKETAIYILLRITRGGEQGSPAMPAVPELLKAVRNAKLSPLAREMAADALGNIGPSAKSYAAELDAASQEGHPCIRILLAYAAARADHVKTKGITRLRQLLTDKDAAAFRWIAAKRLGDLGPVARDAIDDLKKLASDPNPLVRNKAADAVRRINKE